MSVKKSLFLKNLSLNVIDREILIEYFKEDCFEFVIVDLVEKNSYEILDSGHLSIGYNALFVLLENLKEQKPKFKNFH